MPALHEVFGTAAQRLQMLVERATPGPYRPSKTVEGALRCRDAVDGREQHIGYGMRKEDMRLLVTSDPDGIALLAQVLEETSEDDAAAPALARYVEYLSQRMGLKLQPVEFPVDDEAAAPTRVLHPVGDSQYDDEAAAPEESHDAEGERRPRGDFGGGSSETVAAAFDAAEL